MDMNLKGTLLVAIAAGAVQCLYAAAADPAFYQKQATWQETVRVSREALMAQSARTQASNAAATAPGFEPWLVTKACTDVPDSTRPSFQTTVKLNVAGVQELCLGAISLGPRGMQAVEWNDAHLVDKAGKKTLLVSVPVARWLGREDKSAVNVERRQLRLNHCEPHFALNAQFVRLEARVTMQLGDGVVAWADTQSRWAEQAQVSDGKRRILSLLERDFPAPELKRARYFEQRDHIWLKDWKPGDVSELIGRYAAACQTKLREQAKNATDLTKACQLYTADVQCKEMLIRFERVSGEAMQRAVADLTKTFGEKYPKGAEFAARVGKLAAELPQIRERLERGEVAALKDAEAVLEFQKEALLANPLLDFGKLLFVRRTGEENLGLSSNFGPNTNPGGNSEIDVLSPVRADGQVSTLFHDKSKGIVDVDLEFDAERMLFTMNDTNGVPQLWEIKADGSELRQLTPSENGDVAKANPIHNCNGCYLPDGRIVFVSTATMVGVPCVGGSLPVGNLYRLEADGKTISQLTFDQDQDWYPRMLANGRLLYTRWEYTDTPHYFTRLLFTMNPDGTGQSALHHSNSYWPNSTFFTRPIPDHPTKVVGVVTGHHGSQRAGELLIFDPAKGSREADGVVQRIPGYGQKVEPVIKDQLVNDSWPKFLYPYPLSEKYFLVSCKLTPDAPWGLYLVDIFDNLVPLRIEPGYALMEPIPFRKTPRPAVVPDKIDPKRTDAVVYLQDIYSGPGLAGIPQGAVKKLRVFSYAYNYRHMGSHSLVGQESGWDVKRILGTVPVESDGSAMFRVPANTPIALQPLDDEGRALQVMRSWMTARPGETLSCVGCHETMNSAPQAKGPTIAARKKPMVITAWRGPTRGFSFEREVRPVLDKYCIACHNGQPRSGGQPIPNFASRELKPESHSAGTFSEAYLALNPFVRRPGPESDYHLFFPMEWHAGTSELVQMLKKGHHNVKLDAEAWDRLYTWIDLNVPYYGTYRETVGRANAWNPRSEAAAARHRELMKRFAGMDVDAEAIPSTSEKAPKPIMPPAIQAQVEKPQVTGWPFGEKQAKALQAATGKETTRTITLADGVKLNLMSIPAGEFILGDPNGYGDELPLTAVKIENSFWMADVEISNKQFAQFDPTHDSRYQDLPGKDQTTRGIPANQPDQPVVRVTWQQAMDYCKWLSAKTGKHFTLPTEAQWEWACRCGTENAPGKLIGRINSKWSAASNVGQSAPNAWGVKDLYSNVSEWTRTAYRPYPYRDNDGRNEGVSSDLRVVRGASWCDRPQRARAGLREAYQPYQHVFNVGFRVIAED
jgi:formylglycine-generating enzyme required for sulfatase activity